LLNNADGEEEVVGKVQERDIAKFYFRDVKQLPQMPSTFQNL
jgi:hypothetical protein